MKKAYRSALGKVIDIDTLRLNNEEIIAVGNMKVNARGDELGFGGKVVKTRNQLMDDYYRLNTPTVEDSSPNLVEDTPELLKQATSIAEEPIQAAEPMTPQQAAQLKGSLASSLTKK